MINTGLVYLFEVEITKKDKTGNKTAVDINVGHFNYTEGKVNTLPDHLKNFINVLNTINVS